MKVALWVSGLVTVTLTAPAACAAVVAVIDVASTNTTFVAGTPPIVTVAPETNFVPVMVTLVPPSVVPDGGAMLEIVGAVEAYVKPFVSVALWVSEFVTVTFTAPAACAGVVAVIDVAPTTTTLVAGTPPIDTVAPATKFDPVIVIGVPPSVDPDVGETPAIVGAGFDTGLNVAICITQGPDDVSVAVAL